jgi:prepilin-type N-terminal cleavage/methylation domain-containing protein
VLEHHFRHTAVIAFDNRRRGFTLAEILVTIAIVAVLAAVVVPTIGKRLSEGESASLASTLASLRDGILEYRADVRRYPTNLRYLSSAPVSATDLCAQSVPSSFLASWKGPYVDRAITTSGLKVNDGTVADAIALSPSTFTATTTGELSIEVSEVDSTVARRIERESDVTLDFTAGTIRWTHLGNGRGKLSLVIPARGC